MTGSDGISLKFHQQVSTIRLNLAAGPVLLLAGSVVLGTGHSKLQNGAALPATNGGVHEAQHSDGSSSGGEGLLTDSSPNTSESASEVEIVTHPASNGSTAQTKAPFIRYDLFIRQIRRHKS